MSISVFEFFTIGIGPSSSHLTFVLDYSVDLQP